MRSSLKEKQQTQGDQADKLSAQLARECEKRQALELKLKRLEQAQGKPIDEPTVEVVKEAYEPTGFDWRNVSNAELNGDRRHDAYVEKLRRSVEAVREYNAGLHDSEQFAITGSLLRQLTGVKPGKVKLWVDANQAELDSYNAGYGSRQNTGKPNPRTAIKWNEAAYGGYDW